MILCIIYYMCNICYTQMMYTIQSQNASHRAAGPQYILLFAWYEVGQHAQLGHRHPPIHEGTSKDPYASGGSGDDKLGLIRHFYLFISLQINDQFWCPSAVRQDSLEFRHISTLQKW